MLWPVPDFTAYDKGTRTNTLTALLPESQVTSRSQSNYLAAVKKVKVKEVDLYSAFIEVPYTQGAQVRITQCYLHITPYLPLPRKHSPDGASQTEVADI